MPSYFTRHLVSLVERTYFDCPLRAGDKFFATPNDATYFLQHGTARDVTPDDGIAPAPAAPVAGAAPAGSADASALDLGAFLDDTVPHIAAKLPDLTAEQYAKVKEAEIAGKARKSLLAAFDEEDARRSA